MTGAWGLAARNLLRNRRRNLATAIAVALGFAALVILGGYVVHVHHYLVAKTVYLQHHGHIGIFKKDGLDLHLVKPDRYSLTADDQTAIAAVLAGDPDVEMWGRRLDGFGLAGNGCKSVPFVALGVDPAIEARIRSHPYVLANADDIANPLRGLSLAGASGATDGPVLVTESLARRLGKPLLLAEAGPSKPGTVDCAAADAKTRIAADANIQLAGATYAGGFSAIDADIVGLFTTGISTSEDSGLYTTVDVLQRLYGTDKVSEVSVFLRDASAAGRVADRVKQALATRGVQVDTYTYTDARMNSYFIGIFGFLVAMAVVILAIVVSVVMLSILSSMTMTVIDRSREIGTLRSIGFKRSQVALLFLREGMVLTGGALVVGLGLGLGISATVNAVHINYLSPGVPRPTPLVFTPDATMCTIIAAGILMLAALTTWLATRYRTHMKIVDLNVAGVA